MRNKRKQIVARVIAGVVVVAMIVTFAAELVLQYSVQEFPWQLNSCQGFFFAFFLNFSPITLTICKKAQYIQ